MEIKKYFVSLGNCFATAMLLLFPFIFGIVIDESAESIIYYKKEDAQLRRFIKKDEEQCNSLEQRLLLSADKNRDKIVTLEELGSVLRAVGYRGMINYTTQIQVYTPDLAGSAIEPNYRGFLARTETSPRNEVYGDRGIIYLSKKMVADYLRNPEARQRSKENQNE